MVIQQSSPEPGQPRVPSQVVAFVGDDHASVSDPILAITHAAQAASVEAQAYRHCDAHPPIEPLPFVCPANFLPHAEIPAPGRQLTILACPSSGLPQAPVAPMELADLATWIVTPEQVGSGGADAQLLELRGAGLPLAAVVLQADSDETDGDQCVRRIREQLYAHEYDGDALPVLNIPRLAPPDRAPDPMRFSQALHGALSLLEHLDQTPLQPPTSPEEAKPWLTIGDTRSLTRTQTYVVGRIQAGRIHAREELSLTGVRGDHSVVTRVLQRRGGRPPGVMHAGEIVWMHIEHRAGIRVDPGMILFEPGALHRAQSWDVQLEKWGDLPQATTLRVGVRELPIQVHTTGTGHARLTSKTPIHMPSGTPFCLIQQGQITAVGQIAEPLVGADLPASG
ncbi:MAG: hypothetical protein ACPG4T_15395 [Nannocystaceae bacterium]